LTAELPLRVRRVVGVDVTRQYFANMLLAGVLMLWISGCGGESIGICVKPPGTLTHGERGRATVTVDYEDHHADRTVTVRLLPNEHVSIDPSQVKVKLDAKGSGEVTVYVTPRDSAPTGGHTVRIISVTETGHETHFDFTVGVK
jgi:hypothetical protein